MDTIKTAMDHLNRNVTEHDPCTAISFEEFLEELSQKPTHVLRNVFQVFHDMIKDYLGQGIDEYPDDPESIGFVSYDCRRLFVEGADHPFFADRLFANRLISLVDTMMRSSQQNKIYIFKGPPGCGKSTFLNNLLLKFEEYANTEKGMRYETVWRINRSVLDISAEHGALSVLEKLLQFQSAIPSNQLDVLKAQSALLSSEEDIEIPCPSHDHPILMIPKHYRREFFDDLFKNNEFKERLFSGKEYDWVFKGIPCTICSSL
ncbi:MAG: serine protein kinase PrkA, partial [Deltaproteobacteria bacterium]|nr:serine protein kinase PrkA [Deltaproteobacteria bacterium]